MISSIRIAVVVALLLALLAPALALGQAADVSAPPQFTDRTEAERFHALTEELRCVKCQNQSLADSDAAIAQDLRNEVLELMRQGKTNAEVKHYLVARYGEFVLYRPRVEPTTWLLWFGPAVLLLVGGFVVAGIVRKRSGNRQPAEAVDDDQEW
ncbi:cytochrome c-type biogenesis protein [Novilysobacter erysipheiresistens]|uniref:Cytochrome c-type biogenesis protein n=1 Tax=Novilysobacter erysipheiresistens TaxID=1749332 RepID=A0ABU7YVC4_9GAMM